MTSNASAMSKAVIPILANNSAIAFRLYLSMSLKILANSCSIGKNLLPLHRTPLSLKERRITFL